MKNDLRQKLHLEPQSGWLNDPNGLCFFKGEYHVYFQYSPDNAYGKGDKCWGHWASKDMLHWRFTGAVLRPDTPYDKSGVYSGCGFVKDDTLHLFYTGNVKEPGDHDYITSGRGANVIHVSTQNGHDMSEKHVLLKNSDYPGYCSCHVRDPKVWEDNGIFYMVLGARKLDNTGCALFYTSKDLMDWSFEKEVSLPDFGYMWECPDVIQLGGREYLSISPQGLEHGKFEHQNVYSSGYFIGDSFREWDYGFDFYAPQTFTAPDGRKLIIGWMGIGDIPYTNKTADLGWQHCLTLPRELTVSDNGIILQNPAKEFESLRYDAKDFASGDTMTAELPFELTAGAEGDFSISFGNYLEMTYKDKVFTLSFTDHTIGCGRTVRRAFLDTCKNIRIIADTSSLEIYLENGIKVMSTRFYPDNTEVGLSLNGVCGKIYKLNSMEVSDHE